MGTRIPFLGFKNILTALIGALVAYHYVMGHLTTDFACCMSIHR